VVGESAPAPPRTGDDPAAEAAPPPPEEPPGGGTEFEIDPDNDQGEPLDADADARAVADLAIRELGGQVIGERPNDPAGQRNRGSGATGGDGGRARGPRARERSERGKR
jgi:hypothetical protein